MRHVNPGKVIWAEKYRRTHPIDINDEQVGSVGWVIRTGEAVLLRDITEEIIAKGLKDAEQLELLKELSIKSVMIIPMQIKGKVTGVISFVSCNPLNNYDELDFNFAKDFTNRIALTLENDRLYEEIKKEIEERVKADKRKHEFIDIASHELRTPVTSLKAYTQILQETFQDQGNPLAYDMLSKMDKQINKLTELIIDLLDVTKIDKGEVVFDIKEFDFNDLIGEISEHMQRTTKTHKISLVLNKATKVRGDRNRIAQVVTNFISNAIKYSPKATEIIITSDYDNENAKLCVRDFGIGIAKEEQSSIYLHLPDCYEYILISARTNSGV